MREQPHEASFFQAVRKVESLAADRPRIGDSLRPHEDPLRFGQNVSLAFLNSAIDRLTNEEGVVYPRLYVNFMGLTGANGPMPLDFTQFVYDRLRKYGDPTLARFLDMFHHRLISIFYKAWSLNEHAVSYDRPREDWFADYLGNMIGYAGPSRDRDALPFLSRLSYVGSLINGPRHTFGLVSLLESYFQTPVRISTFVLCWLGIPSHSRCQLGRPGEASQLGYGSVVGRQAPARSQQIDIRIGPMSLEQYHHLTPGERGDAQLQAWISSYLARPLRVATRIVLRADQVPRCTLGRYGRLGRTAWTITRQPDRDADQLCRVRGVHPITRERERDASPSRRSPAPPRRSSSVTMTQAATPQQD